MEKEGGTLLFAHLREISLSGIVLTGRILNLSKYVWEQTPSQSYIETYFMMVFYGVFTCVIKDTHLS